MVWPAIVFILILLLALFLLNFYRDPKRNIPPGNDIVSPADGKIIRILTAKQNKMTIRKGFIGRVEAFARDIAPECIIVSIFMSPFDVHVNKSLIEGRVISIKHTPGKYFSAFSLKKSLMNLKNEYEGMPITLNGILIPSLFLFKVPVGFYPYIYIALGILMISSIKFRKI